jgi:hypothetical protein
VIDTVLLVIALICFIAEAIGLSAPRVSLLAVGLACWVATALV